VHVCPGLHSVNVHAQCAWHVVVAVGDGSHVNVGLHPSTASARDARRRRRRRSGGVNILWCDV
jgi:hypothetical protein